MRLLPYVAVLGFALTANHYNQVFAQGSLNPSGAPGPTMLALHQVEPRTPITNLPFEIQSAGSYFLTAPLSSTNQGIKIAASHVTLDLMGFPITGTQSPGSRGVHIQGGEDVMLENITVRNGVIVQFDKGILVENAQGGRIHDLIVANNLTEGIELARFGGGVCTDFTIEDCTVRNNQGSGIYLNNGGGGLSLHKNHTVRHCNVSGNRTFGINLIFTSGCVIDGNTVGPQIDTNGTFGVRSGNGSGNFIVRNFENGNDIGYLYSPGSDTRGPTITTIGSLSYTNHEVHPWANFSR